MTAPDELDAAILAQLNIVREEAITATSTYIGTQLSVPHLIQHLGDGGTRILAARAIRAACDDWARAEVDKAVGAYRLAAATAEYTARPS